jgi:very-short-patch-repair endonuclease
MLETRVRTGRLARVHPGVYRCAGAPLTFEQQAFAAVAWAGHPAVLSHRSAAHLWQMTTTKAPAVTEICSPRKRTRPPRSISAHFTTDLPTRDCGKLRNVPVTSPARTLIDLAAVLPESLVEEALHRAIVGGCLDARVLRERLARACRQGSRGPAVLRKLLESSARESHVATPLERAVAAALTSPLLPPFRREYPVFVKGDVYYLDFAFPHFRVAVEADGRRWHSDAESFERDRARHNALTAAGWKIIRVTAEQVRNDPDGVRQQVVGLVQG